MIIGHRGNGKERTCQVRSGIVTFDRLREEVTRIKLENGIIKSNIYLGNIQAALSSNSDVATSSKEE